MGASPVTKDQYIKSQAGKTYTVIVAEQPTELHNAALLPEDSAKFTTLIAQSLGYDVQTYAPQNEAGQRAKIAVQTAIDPAFVNSPRFIIDFSDPAVVAQYDAAISIGVISQGSADALRALYRKPRPVYDISREDCARVLGPDWSEPIETGSSELIFTLAEDVPEPCTLSVRLSDVLDGDPSWYHATTIGVAPGRRRVRVPLPVNGFRTLVSWRCEYALDCVVS